MKKARISHAVNCLSFCAALGLTGCSEDNPAGQAGPDVPANVTAVAQSESVIAVFWTSVSGADSYAVYRNGDSTAAGTTAAPPFLDSGLIAGTSYSYRVTSIAAGRESASSVTAVAATCPAPESETILTVVSPNGCRSYRVGDTMAIAWRISERKSSMQILFSSDNGRTLLTIGNVNASEPTYLTGPFLWEIPDSVISQDGFDRMGTASDSCVILVQDYSLPVINDGSDAPFAVHAR